MSSVYMTSGRDPWTPCPAEHCACENYIAGCLLLLLQPCSHTALLAVRDHLCLQGLVPICRLVAGHTLQMDDVWLAFK